MDTDFKDADQNSTRDLCFSKFSSVLTTFVINHLRREERSSELSHADDSAEFEDPIDLIREFRSISAEMSIKSLSDNNGLTSQISQDYELEAKFWHLVEVLLDFRTSCESSDLKDLSRFEAKPYNSNTVYATECLRNNKQLYQIWLIINWLQSNFPKVERPENIAATKWNNTIMSGTLHSIDLDLPLRDKAVKIDSNDKNQDHVFYRYIFELLICGEYDRIFEECKLSDNITLYMIMCGMKEYIDPSVDTQLQSDFEKQQGVQKRVLWRRAVYNLSLNESLDSYERAIYSFLAGDLPKDDDVRSNLDWNKELLIFLNQYINIEIENYLLKMGKVTNDELIMTLPSKPLELQSILNILSAKYETEASHPIRVLMGAVMLDTLPNVLHSSVEMLMDILNGDDNDNDLFNEPYLLRIVTHLSLFLELVLPDLISKEDDYNLITAYISILRLHTLFDLIPVYVKFLDTERCIESYSFILSTLDDIDSRMKQVELCDSLSLPIVNILKRTTERVFSDTEEYYVPTDSVTITNAKSDVDEHLILAVEWLILGKQFEDAVSSTIALARRFLINGKIGSLSHFFSKNHLTTLIKNYQLTKLNDTSYDSNSDSSILEIKEYNILTNIFEQYEQWHNSIKLLNSQSNIPSLIEKFTEYSRNTTTLIKSFLVELTADHSKTDYRILFEIRALYTPYLIIELHKGLLEAASLLNIPKFVNQALEFTNLVANEDDKIYLLFQSSGRLKEYLKLVAYTATL